MIEQLLCNAYGSFSWYRSFRCRFTSSIRAERAPWVWGERQSQTEPARTASATVMANTQKLQLFQSYILQSQVYNYDWILFELISLLNQHDIYTLIKYHHTIKNREYPNIQRPQMVVIRISGIQIIVTLYTQINAPNSL